MIDWFFAIYFPSLNEDSFWILIFNFSNSKKVVFFKTHSVRGIVNKKFFTDESSCLGFIYIIRDPREIVISYSKYTGKTINDVWGVASFYTNFRFTPPGDVTLDICWGPTCHILGSQKILRDVHGLLGIDQEGETKDGKITLRYSTCLGACSQGPVFAIDHKLFGKASLSKIKERISDI